MDNIDDLDKIDFFWGEVKKGRIAVLLYVLFALLANALVLGAIHMIFNNAPIIIFYVVFFCIYIKFSLVSINRLKNIRCPYCNDRSGAYLFMGFIPEYIYCKSCGKRIERNPGRWVEP
jgi:DNA-directed RNA polymerase subunit RPC12/RpoP